MLTGNKKGAKKRETRGRWDAILKNDLKWTFKLKEGGVDPGGFPRTVGAEICDGACSNPGPDI